MARPDQLHLAVVPAEAGCEPFLPLPAIAPAPGLRPQVLGQVISVPLRALGDNGDRADAGLLVELAQRCLAHVLVLVDAALRHLPPAARTLGLTRRVVAAADPHLPGAIQHHDAHARAVAEGVACHRRFSDGLVLPVRFDHTAAPLSSDTTVGKLRSRKPRARSRAW